MKKTFGYIRETCIKVEREVDKKVNLPVILSYILDADKQKDQIRELKYLVEDVTAIAQEHGATAVREVFADALDDKDNEIDELLDKIEGIQSYCEELKDRISELEGQLERCES